MHKKSSKLMEKTSKNNTSDLLTPMSLKLTKIVSLQQLSQRFSKITSFMSPSSPSLLKPTVWSLTKSQLQINSLNFFRRQQNMSRSSSPRSLPPTPLRVNFRTSSSNSSPTTRKIISNSHQEFIQSSYHLNWGSIKQQ